MAGCRTLVDIEFTRKAVDRLPKRLKASKAEEWAAELEAMEGARIAPVLLSASFIRAANKISAGEGATGGRTRRLRVASMTINVDGVFVMFRPGVGPLLADGRRLVVYSATYPGGYATTGKIAVAGDATPARVFSAIVARFEIASRSAG